MSREADRALDGALAALAAECAGRSAPARVEARLLAEFRRRKALRRWQWARWAAAAMFVFAVWLAVLRPVRGPETARPQVFSEFIPVAYGEPVRPEDSVRILRVRMPRSALASFGLPVNPERLDERIQADVVLGDDNLVRAVRFEQ